MLKKLVVAIGSALIAATAFAQGPIVAGTFHRANANDTYPIVNLTDLGAGIANVAALRGSLLSTLSSSVITLQGYYAAGDGGGGALTQNPIDTSSADNGCTIFVDGAGRRWYAVFSNNRFDVRRCGARGNGTSDDIGSIDAATTAAYAAGGTIYFPEGTYAVSHHVGGPIGYNGNVTFEGSGRYTATIKIISSGTGDDVFRIGVGYPGSQTQVVPRIIVKNLGFNGNAGNIGSCPTDTYCNGINMNWLSNSSIDGVYVFNITYQCALFEGASDFSATNNSIRNSNLTGCGEIAAGLEGGVNDSDISGNWIHDLPAATATAVDIATNGGFNGHGQKVINNSFSNLAGAGIVLADGSDGAIIANNSFRSVATSKGAAIYLAQFFTSSPKDVNIIGNTFDTCGNTSVGYGAQILLLNSDATAHGYASITGNVFRSPPSGVGAILINSGIGTTITGGEIDGPGGAGTSSNLDYGISIQGGATNTYVAGVGLSNIPTAARGYLIGTNGAPFATGTIIKPGALSSVANLFGDSGTNTTMQGVPITVNATVTASGGGFALGNGTAVWYYTKTGKVVNATLIFTYGSTTTPGSGNILVQPPIAPSGTIQYQLGSVYASTSQVYTGVALWNGAQIVSWLNVAGSGGANLPINFSGSVPSAWANGNFFTMDVTYQAAF